MQKGWGGAITGRWSQGHEGPRPQCLPKPLLCLPSPWRLSGPLWWRHHAPKSLMGALPPRRHLHLHTCSGLPQLCPPAGPGDKPGGMLFRFPTRDLPRPASDPQRFARVPPRCLWPPTPETQGAQLHPLGQTPPQEASQSSRGAQKPRGSITETPGYAPTHRAPAPTRGSPRPPGPLLPLLHSGPPNTQGPPRFCRFP